MNYEVEVITTVRVRDRDGDYRVGESHSTIRRQIVCGQKTGLVAQSILDGVEAELGRAIANLHESPPQVTTEAPSEQDLPEYIKDLSEALRPKGEVMESTE